MTARSKFSPICPAHADSKHKWQERWTPECQHPWQWQVVCGCGAKKSEECFGVAPAEQALAATTDPLVVQQPFSLDSPADLTRTVQALFDANLSWSEAIRTLFPSLPEPEIFSRAQEFESDPRVQAAISAYIKSLTNNDTRYALLLHMSEKMAADDTLSGAVRSTALNVLKAARVVERTEQAQTARIQISDLSSILKGIGAELPTQEEKEIIN